MHSLEKYLSDLYDGFVVCSLQELNKALIIFASVGCRDILEEFWAVMELNWDIQHIERRIEKLFCNKGKSNEKS